MSERPFPGARRSTFIALQALKVMLKTGWTNFRTAILASLRESPYNQYQLEGLKAVPHDRILLEADSPYMPVNKENRINTPAYIGDIAQVVAKERGVSVEELLAVTVTNGQQLYQ